MAAFAPSPTGLGMTSVTPDTTNAMISSSATYCTTVAPRSVLDRSRMTRDVTKIRTGLPGPRDPLSGPFEGPIPLPSWADGREYVEPTSPRPGKAAKGDEDHTVRT